MANRRARRETMDTLPFIGQNESHFMECVPRYAVPHIAVCIIVLILSVGALTLLANINLLKRSNTGLQIKELSNNKRFMDGDVIRSIVEVSPKTDTHDKKHVSTKVKGTKSQVSNKVKGNRSQVHNKVKVTTSLVPNKIKDTRSQVSTKVKGTRSQVPNIVKGTRSQFSTEVKGTKSQVPLKISMAIDSIPQMLSKDGPIVTTEIPGINEKLHQARVTLKDLVSTRTIRNAFQTSSHNIQSARKKCGKTTEKRKTCTRLLTLFKGSETYPWSCPKGRKLQPHSSYYRDYKKIAEVLHNTWNISQVWFYEINLKTPTTGKRINVTRIIFQKDGKWKAQPKYHTLKLFEAGSGSFENKKDGKYCVMFAVNPTKEKPESFSLRPEKCSIKAPVLCAKMYAGLPV